METVYKIRNKTLTKPTVKAIIKQSESGLMIFTEYINPMTIAKVVRELGIETEMRTDQKSYTIIRRK